MSNLADYGSGETRRRPHLADVTRPVQKAAAPDPLREAMAELLEGAAEAVACAQQMLENTAKFLRQP